MSNARKLADNLPTDGQLGNRSLFINGAMQVAQRGNVTGATNTVFGGPDRMRTLHSATTYANDVAQEEDGPDGFRYSYKFTTSTVRTGSTADQYVGVYSKLEVQDVFNLLWSNNTHMTFSFWVKSSITGDFAFNCNAGETNSGGSAKRILYHSIYTINTANTWEYKTVTIPLSFLSSYALDAGTSDNAAGMEITWVLDVSSGGSRSTASLGWNNPSTEARNAVTSSAGADTGFFSTLNATWQITGVQLEVGEAATPFEHRSVGDELARCQRYFQRHDNDNSAYRWFGDGYTTSTTAASIGVALNPPMRAIPSLSLNVGASNFIFDQQGGAKTCSAITSSFSSNTMARLFLTIATTTASTPGWLASDGTSSLRALDFDAEL